MGPGRQEPDRVVSAGEGQREGGRQSGEGAEHRGKDFGFCSEATGGLQRVVTSKTPEADCYIRKARLGQCS